MESLLHADDVHSGVPPTRLEYRLRRSITFDPTVDRAQIFRGVSIGCFPWSSMDFLLHANDVRSGPTTDSSRILAEKVHNL